MQTIRLIIFGLGQNLKKIEQEFIFKENVSIIAYADSKIKAGEGRQYQGKPCISPQEIAGFSYDVILITPYYFGKEIEEQLLELSVKKKRIIRFEDTKLVCSFADYSWLRDHGTAYSPEDNMKKQMDLFDLGSNIKSFSYAPLRIESWVKTETWKARERRQREQFFERYCQGRGLDIGHGGDPLTDACAGWEYDNGDAQFLRGVADNHFDYVYSSHCLEHMVDVKIALLNWFRVVKPGGYLILYLPERDLYEKQRQLPSKWNPDHKHMFLLGQEDAPDTLDIIEEIKKSLKGYSILYAKVCSEGHTIDTPLVHSDGEYSIEIVIKKLEDNAQ